MLMEVATGTGLLAVTGWVIAALLVWTRERFPARDDLVVAEINRRLPQTQCAQCGYPGCRPYAEAIAVGEAINRCPPGGNATIADLAQLLGRDITPVDTTCGEPGVVQVAAIRENECIGCTLCIAACPVDAIFGAPQLMHTVIEAECTGCELCLPPCPVDCIDLIRLPASGVVSTPVTEAPPTILAAETTECIRCGLCEAACPRALAPQDLYWFRDSEPTLDALRLDACIECRRCDRVCPSNLPLTQIFRASKAAINKTAEAARLAQHAESRYEAHQQRIARAGTRVRQRPSASDRAALLSQLQSRKRTP